MDVKVLITYPKNVSFGIEVDVKTALEMVTAWLEGNTEIMEIDGYGFFPNEVLKIELFYSVGEDNA
ncbi:hypothetical protein [Phage f2b1]|nr:hypothetical protein [Phage f2b1]